MQGFFSTEILSAAYLPHRFLFADTTDKLFSETVFSQSNIYFITKTKKLRFHPTKLSVNPLGQCKLYVNVGNNPAIRVDMSIEALLPLQGFKLKQLPLSPPILSRPRIDWTKTNGHEIAIVGKLWDESEVSLLITIESIIAGTDIDFGTYPEVVYIGQSFRILERLREHKKLNQAVAELADDEEIRVTFIHFKIGVAGIEPFGPVWKDIIEIDDKRSTEYRDKISLIEQILISFFRPKYNTQHIDEPLYKSPRIKRILSRRGIKTIIIGIGMHGHNWKFWSPRQALEAEIVSYKFDLPEEGFTPGIPMI